MKIPFDIKYKPQIESGEYKVETKSGFPAKIIHCDGYGEAPILVTVDLGDGCGAQTRLYFADGKLYKEESDADLFIVTKEEEMTPFEKEFLERVFHQKTEDLDEQNKEIFLEDARYVLALAHDQFIKDGYVIEKKVFHDAVEKVAPEVMKEVSENVDKTNEELTEFEKAIADLCWKVGIGEVIKDVEQIRPVAKELLEIAKKQLILEFAATHYKEVQKAREEGKAGALKNLPRWSPNDIYPELNDVVISSIGTDDHFFIHRGKIIHLESLENLPGFNE